MSLPRQLAAQRLGAAEYEADATASGIVLVGEGVTDTSIDVFDKEHLVTGTGEWV